MQAGFESGQLDIKLQNAHQQGSLIIVHQVVLFCNLNDYSYINQNMLGITYVNTSSGDSCLIESTKKLLPNH